IRYYRWMSEPSAAVRSEGLRHLNIPKILGDAADDGNENLSPADADPSLRDAEYAIVAAGPNRAFGDIDGPGSSKGTEKIEDVRKAIGAAASRAALSVEQEARKDNIVESGK